jgi:hypothetical protein
LICRILPSKRIKGLACRKLVAVSITGSPGIVSDQKFIVPSGLMMRVMMMIVINVLERPPEGYKDGQAKDLNTKSYIYKEPKPQGKKTPYIYI